MTTTNELHETACVAESPVNYAFQSSAKHHWQSDGLSSYPPKDPLVGQSQFFNDFESFIHLVDKEDNNFAQVFSMVAEWGRGKSRLGYELIAQINDASPGWYCRDQAGDLKQSTLFRSDADREQYLGLYIRYSQIATEFQNSDNWFAYGLYTALQPLAKNTFDGSIQSQVAKQCFDRLEVEGFDHQELANRLEINKKYSDKELYDDEFLATRLVNAAYEYLQQFGIKYLLVVLDELETAAEAATYGLEGDDLKRLDGRAIKLMGQAIKEEDPRRKLPWLRYVALCSPAIGEELREVSSLARRFSMLDLEHNAFSDVSDYVATLTKSGRLAQNYLPGLVESAYAMSGGNFGWFNVIMAAVDEKLTSLKMNGETVKSIGQLFNAVVNSSPRIRDHVLDAGAIGAIKTTNLKITDAATELLYGQLPIALDTASDETKALVSTLNEYEEPVATYYNADKWTVDSCRPALQNAKFKRDKGDLWLFDGIEQQINLKQLLANLSTFAIHEQAGQLLIPTSKVEFIELLQLLYPHGATDDIARALWLHFYSDVQALSATPTHIGPSVAMLNRLNLRYRKQSQHSLIFRDQDYSNAHEKIMANRSEKISDKQRTRLTGLMRLIDSHWQYDAVDSELVSDLNTIATNASRAKQDVNGLASCRALQLHPKGRVVFAYVSNEVELKKLCSQATAQFGNEGRYPVIAVTSSIDLSNKFQNASDPVLQKAKDYLCLYRLSHNEEHILEQIGIATKDCHGFVLEMKGFTTKFMQRLNALNRGVMECINIWRQGLHERGLIAMPLRVGQKLNDKDRETLVQGWADLIVRSNVKSLSRYDKTPKSVADDALYDLVHQLRVPTKEQNDGFSELEWSQLFTSTNELSADAQFPVFVCRLMKERLFKSMALTFEQAKQDWFFGYSWIVTPKEVFTDWMLILRTALLITESADPSKPKVSIYRLFKRSAFEGNLTEADNWLKNDYPQQVDTIATLFGEGRINELFAPLGRTKVGTKTNKAKAKLVSAKKYQDTFKRIEETDLIKLSSDENSYQLALSETSQARFNHQQAVDWVYDADKYKVTLKQDQFFNLDFELDKTPLWQRIARAKAFSDQVYKTESAISKRTTELIALIKKDNSTLIQFPINIFTLSLEKISHILAGAVKPGTMLGETADKQQSEAGTLGYYLRNLEVDRALSRLEQLAKEVGYSPDTELFSDIEQIDGAIISAYRMLKQEFEKQLLRATTAKEGIAIVERDLVNAPSDYAKLYPDGSIKLANLQKKVKHVDSLFDDVQDDANDLKDKINSEMQLGQFRLLNDQVPPLLDGVKKQLTQWQGDIDSLKNFSKGYRESLLNSQNTGVDSALNVLKKVNHQSPLTPLMLKNVEAFGTLADAKEKLSQREVSHMTEITSLLNSTLISAERWVQIVQDMADDNDPALQTDEAEELVAKQVIVRTYRLGGVS
ncbi:hypothetical protein [Psychromonas arctica]|uniref:hypothetical protein n=1 Tax=Psychromonas arctica TaxID=168275 RepID=UPI00040389A8|nr:hypothetical protein [Psychromonas arctica]